MRRRSSFFSSPMDCDGATRAFVVSLALTLPGFAACDGGEVDVPPSGAGGEGAGASGAAGGGEGTGGGGALNPSGGGGVAGAGGAVAGGGGAPGTGGAGGAGGAAGGNGPGGGAGGGNAPGCGNAVCDAGETCITCAQDCGACCGNGTCDHAVESCDSCAADCPGCAGCWATGPTADLDAEEQAFLVLLNDYRQQNGKAPLKSCRSLHRASQGHSENMRDLNYFNHIGPDGPLPGDRACKSCYQAACFPNSLNSGNGENIAGGNHDAQSTFEQWKNSSGHNANMLDEKWIVTGIGRATGGGTYGVYWTSMFANVDEPSCD